MSFASPTSHLRSSSTHGGLSLALLIPATTRTTTGVFPSWKQVTYCSSYLLKCNAISRPRTEGIYIYIYIYIYSFSLPAEYIDVIQNGLQVIKWPQETVEDDTEKDIHHLFTSTKEPVSDKIRELVGLIRSMLQSMDDGEISVSPYDTAWVALVEDISGGGGAPQFPSSLEWICNNQLCDGSWGDSTTFSIYDQIINTLACVVALRFWNKHPDKTNQGISFFKENIHKLEDENEEHMTIGFEVALPSLLEIAKKLDIDIPYDSPGLQQIYARRDIKLTRIPRDIVPKVPTTALYSLEGMPGLMWQKLLHLQSAEGSFLFSPSSTAFALQQTKDHNCLNYLANLVHKFNGGVPNVYWTNKGICWARDSEVQDIDDTSMAFRLMRLHGYNISADVFKHFEKGGEFFSYVGQSNQAVTGMYNLYRASQVMFPGEEVLSEAKKFSAKFLQEKRADNELLDKWVIAKDLRGEVGYALDVPWYGSLPRVEARFYLEQYGGEDDVWIGKTLYRMPYVSNNTYLGLAKLDYNSCQALHQREWKNIQKWYRNNSVGEFGLSETRLLQAYYIAAASVFEPEKSEQRLAWAKTAILMETIVSQFNAQQLSRDQKRIFVNEFEHGNRLKYANGGRYKTRTSLVGTLLRTLNHLSMDILLAHSRDIHQQLNNAWLKWLKTWENGGDIGEGDAELLVCTLALSRNQIGEHKNDWISEEIILSHPKYQHLLKVTNCVSHQLRLFQHPKVSNSNGCMTNMEGITTVEIESQMQELVKLVVTKSSDDLDSDFKQIFLDVARSFYYAAYCNQGTIKFHIAKVLFERVL
ncbi:hypothetical protein BUALT_Bualt02G0219100 [Buddleja alternifolia]|uniref:Ent-copalyl diphosphate synthase n=1 Tax=Buddleja alternifolia TaxID=168488 RepID=A0AAV6YDA7_9LAMI|nr:hypothetical protein BUALT_Bualt02G0219100 [Buddleja alternifolia]